MTTKSADAGIGHQKNPNQVFAVGVPTRFGYLFLGQASVADPPVPWRTDDGTAWERKSRKKMERRRSKVNNRGKPLSRDDAAVPQTGRTVASL